MKKFFSFFNSFFLKSVTYFKNYITLFCYSFKVKLIILTFVCIYAIFLCFTYYYLYKSYQLTMDYINSVKVIELNRDINSLFCFYPYFDSSMKYFSPELINRVYNIHGI